MAKKIILVTGGAGFVGSSLIARLALDADNEIYSLDNYFAGSADNHVEGVEYIEGHTKDIAALVPVTPDIVYHLGEYSRVERSMTEMREVWDLNIHGTFEVLEFCRTKQCKLLYAGSSTKFAADGAGRNQSPYAWSKATNSELVKNYGEWFGLEYAITYFYNVYGPGERGSGEYATVIGIFAELAAAGKSLPVVSPGTQERNFTHIDDIVDGLVLVGKKGSGDEYGLGSPESFSIMDVAQMFGGEIEMMPERKGNRMGSGLDASRAVSELGWKARHSLPDYITSLKNNP